MAITTVTEPGTGVWSTSYPLIVELSSNQTAQDQHRFYLDIYVDFVLVAKKWTVATDSNVAIFDISQTVKRAIELSELAASGWDLPMITNAQKLNSKYSPVIGLQCKETYWNGTSYVTVAGPALTSFNAYKGYSSNSPEPRELEEGNFADWFGLSDTEPFLFSGDERMCIGLNLYKSGWTTPSVEQYMHIQVSTNNGFGPTWYGPVDRLGTNTDNMKVYMPLRIAGFTNQSTFQWLKFEIYLNNSLTPGGTLKETIQIDKTMTIDDCPDEVIPLMFRDRFGGWTFIPFSMKQYLQTNAEGEQYENIDTGLEKYNIESRDTLTLNTDYIDEKYNEQFKDLLTSELCFIKEGTAATGGLVKYVVADSSISYKTKRNDRLVQYTVRLRKSLINFHA